MKSAVAFVSRRPRLRNRVCVCVWCVARPYLLSIAGYSIPSPQLCGAREQLFEGTDGIKKQKKQAITILHSVDRLLRPN